MTLRSLPLALLLSALLLPACDSGDDEGGPNVDCPTAKVPTFADFSAFAKSTTCHSSTLTVTARNAAPEGIN